MMTEHNMEQRTPEWYKARLGQITGSRIGDLIGVGRKDKFTAAGMALIRQIAGERMLDLSFLDDELMFAAYIDEASTTSKAMRIGIEREEEARSLYEFTTGRVVTPVGSLKDPQAEYLSSSPDGVVIGIDGVVTGCIEVKCPTPQKYPQYAMCRTADDVKELEPKYYWQCMAHMAVTDAQWCDFIAYCPYSRYTMNVVTINRDDEAIARMRLRAAEAEEMIASIVNEIEQQINQHR